jgi:hypothetical protein
MEGRVFVCTWERSGARYRVWVRDRPSLGAEGDVFDAADEALADAICGATGDGESVREYDPPRPREEPAGLLFRLAQISGERRGFIGNPAELFNEDYCPQCKRPRGNRTAMPLRLARIEPGQGGGFAKMEPPALVGPLMSFFPETFVACLRPEERSQFQWRPVHLVSKRKESFVELISANVHISFVSLSGAVATLWNRPGLMEKERQTLWRCDTCGRTQQRLYSYRMNSLPPYYVNVADLREPLPTCIGVGDPEYPRLCFTRERWSELMKLPESRGIASMDVGVVAPSLVDSTPAVRSLAAISKESR